MDLYKLVPKQLQKIVSPTFFRYGIMAVIVVGIELLSFWVLNSPFKVNYLLATILSQLLGIFLNWIGSRYYVFGPSRHTAKKEFTFVVMSSLVGTLLQSAVVVTVVEGLGSKPLYGKIIAIIITFFWNYIIRKKYIYNKEVRSTDRQKPDYSTIAKHIGIYILLTTAVFAFLYWRHPNNIKFANFYGEDGSVYLQNILNKGWLRASISPFNGYSIVGLYGLCALGWVINLFMGGTVFTLPAAFAAAAILFMAAVISLPYLLFKRNIGTIKVLIAIAFSALLPLPMTPHVVLGTIGNQKWIFMYLAFLLIMYRVFNFKTINLSKLIIIDLLILVCGYTNSTVYLIMPICLVPYLQDYWVTRGKSSLQKFVKKLIRITSFQSLVVVGVLLVPQLLYVALHGIPKLPGYLEEPFEYHKFIEVFVNRTYIFGITHYINGLMSDVAALLIFSIIVYFAFKHLKGIRLTLFLAGVYSAGMASLLFCLNRTGVTYFFHNYNPAGSGPDQFFYTQTLIMCLPIVLAISATIENQQKAILRKALTVGMVVFVVGSGFLSIARYGSFWKNVSEFQNDSGTFVDQAIITCSQQAQPAVHVTVFPYKSGQFAVTFPRDQVCNDQLLAYQPTYNDYSLQLNNNDHLPLLESKEFTQTFIPGSNGLNGIKLFISNFGITYRRGEYSLLLMDAQCKNTLRTTIIPSQLRDGSYYDALFAPINDSKDKTYCFTINPPPGIYDKIAIQRSQPDQYTQGLYSERGVDRDVDVVFEPLFTSKRPDK